MQKDREIFPSSHLQKLQIQKLQIYGANSDQDNGQVCKISSSREIKSRFPYLADSVQQMVHIKKAGALDVYALGTLMLSLARKSGVQLQRSEVTGISRQANKFLISTDEGEAFETNQIVLAA